MIDHKVTIGLTCPDGWTAERARRELIRFLCQVEWAQDCAKHGWKGRLLGDSRVMAADREAV